MIKRPLIAKTLGVKKVSSRDFGSWANAQAATRDGKADVIFGIYRNDERMQWLDYVEPSFMMDPVSIVVRTGGGFAFAKWDDLKGRKGVTNVGESFGDKFDAFMAKNLEVVRAQGVDKAFAALLDKSADYPSTPPAVGPSQVPAAPRFSASYDVFQGLRTPLFMPELAF